MIIYIPNNCIYERQYIVDMFFGDHLGLDYQTRKCDINDYKIEIDSHRKLIIKDRFFNRFDHDLEYLNNKNIPSNVQFLRSDMSPEGNLPILYGTDELVLSDKEVVCGLDIFASAFFMVTRWEEFVNPIRDRFSRFPAKSSISWINDFLHRPIVDEYTEFLWNMLQYLGIKQKRKERHFRLIPTHDVDFIRYWKNGRRMIRNAGRQIIKDRNAKGALESFLSYAKIKTKIKPDPYVTFDWLMDISEYEGLKSHFYFMSGGKTGYDNHYKIDDPQSKKLVSKILKRGHKIGFHPSFDSYNNPEQWEKEKNRLESVLGFQIDEGRQHYLRFSVPKTWEVWEKNGMKMDSTLCYPDQAGFRCGTCHAFHPFHILKREKLRLKESPLIVMEVSFMTYETFSPDDMFNQINNIIKKVKQYKGDFVLLWHNSNFLTDEWLPYRSLYRKVLKMENDSI